MFMNEYNTLEQPGDMAALPGRYLQRLRQIIAAYPENGAGMAIGLEGHFTTPNIPYMRAALDTLAQAGIPVWLTEVDVAAGPAQAQHLEEVLREAYAHPAVQGIVLWSAWRPEGCYVMCLTDNNFSNLPQGDVVDRLIAEWRATPRGATDAQGYFEANLPHGEYKVTVSHPALNSSVSRSVRVDRAELGERILHRHPGLATPADPSVARCVMKGFSRDIVVYQLNYYLLLCQNCVSYLSCSCISVFILGNCNARQVGKRKGHFILLPNIPKVKYSML